MIENGPAKKKQTNANKQERQRFRASVLKEKAEVRTEAEEEYLQ